MHAACSAKIVTANFYFLLVSLLFGFFFEWVFRESAFATKTHAQIMTLFETEGDTHWIYDTRTRFIVSPKMLQSRVTVKTFWMNTNSIDLNWLRFDRFNCVSAFLRERALVINRACHGNEMEVYFSLHFPTPICWLLSKITGTHELTLFVWYKYTSERARAYPTAHTFSFLCSFHFIRNVLTAVRLHAWCRCNSCIQCKRNLSFSQQNANEALGFLFVYDVYWECTDRFNADVQNKR